MRIGSDRDIGGHSWARLRDPTPDMPYTTFHGRTSHLLPRDRPDVARVGYAAFRSPDPEMNLFGRDYWDTGLYRYLSIRARLPKDAPVRRFMVNVQTAGIVKTDLFQHRLYLKTPRPGQGGDGWQDVHIPWASFVLTNNGRVLSQQMTMLRERVRSVGISVADGPTVEGLFALDIAWFRMWNSPVSLGDSERIYF
ncbi:NADH:ubiquinone oxidoreductase intermediate-associated protein 30 [Piptocephalis cylindrospora]|uniref:NADH:ubiquinone oxidoreductase intermediate-associated protein 30 n=1 Tax=Piptocephalis cylindrospora TaxID=1907219 RepID=A0A4P9Y6Y9_9FUNG|nr:NADH:ubiquinone oxidoreductase intermediate-associated protein 30 [Piptocephalis cylindrospora]|eukprot:RKP14582.1 NADH:ubiquinone oxidoreductase intermediate-associated protein 30 [Piptocephalis cylindrospora]